MPGDFLWTPPQKKQIKIIKKIRARANRSSQDSPQVLKVPLENMCCSRCHPRATQFQADPRLMGIGVLQLGVNLLSSTSQGHLGQQARWNPATTQNETPNLGWAFVVLFSPDKKGNAKKRGTHDRGLWAALCILFFWAWYSVEPSTGLGESAGFSFSLFSVSLFQGMLKLLKTVL